MGGGGTRVGFERFRERLHGAGIIHGIDATFAEDKMRFLFFIERAGRGRQTAVDGEQRQRGEGDQTNSGKK